jgi:FkbM family methyltransferase
MITKAAKKAITRVIRMFDLEIHRASHSDPMERFLRFLANKGFRPKCVLDVGANRTTWSAMASKIFPTAKFVLIEPQQEMKGALEAFCASHQSSRYVMAGAGAKPGELVQTIWEDRQGSSFLAPVEDEKSPLREKRKTPIVTIDSIFAQQDPLPELVKLDIQGFELEALKGANCLFGFTECFILEVSLFAYMPGLPEFGEVIEFMRQRHYVVYDLCGSCPRPHDGALGQMDLAFVKAKGKFRASNAW